MPRDSASFVAPGGALPPAPRYADLVDFGRDAIGGAINVSAALSAGIEAIGREWVQYGQGAFEVAGETARGLLSARTVEDLVRLQSDYAKRSFAAVVESSGKLSQLGCAVLSATVSAWFERKTP